MSGTLITAQSTPQVNHLLIRSISQRLVVCCADGTSRRYRISTASAGMGNIRDSYQTPTGWHGICNKIGDGQPPLMIFQGRKSIGQLATINSTQTSTNKDLITSRILWLEGLEDGINRGGHVDSRERYIYIHGTHEEGLIGRPASKGCIRMINSDIIELYAMVATGTRVLIE